MDPVTLYILLLSLGLLLFGLELFVPGGVLGVGGGLMLVGAIVIGFSPKVFGPQGGFVSAVLILVGVCVYVGLVLKFLPNSPIGRRLTLTNNLGESRSSQAVEDHLLGQSGTAETDLRPSGIISIAGRRIDVTADSAWVAKGSAVKVIEVTGNRIVVREVNPA